MTRILCPCCGTEINGPTTTPLRLYNMLEIYAINHPGQYLSTKALTERLGITENNLKVTIHNLRRALIQEKSPTYIDTMYGAGYCLKRTGDQK